MRLFIHSGTYMIQCTNRMLCNQVFPKPKKKFSIPYFKKNPHLFGSVLNFQKRLENNEIIKDQDWSALRHELLEKYHAPEEVADTLICEICNKYQENQEMSYIKFLQNHNYKLNLNILGIYLKSYGKKKSITKEDEEEIYRIYDSLKKQYPILDSTISYACIMALSRTKRWKESLDLMEMLDFAETLKIKAYTATICAAFNFNEPHLAWKLFDDVIKYKFTDHTVFTKYLDYCIRNFKDAELENQIEKMFYFWSQNMIIPNKTTVNKYASAYENLGYHANFISIDNHENYCQSCSQKLRDAEISIGDFKTLSAMILKKVIIGNSVYLSASPQELKKYKVFIESMKPYDIVIDGLNVAYSGNFHKKDRGSLENVLTVVNYFENKRILVVGRVHMNWWNRTLMAEIEEKADLYFLKNLTVDDAFLLHIALLSGPKTHFVSRDLMRQHLFLIDDTYIKAIFKRWQISRQYRFYNCTSGIKLVPPLKIDISVQKNENVWHIPIATDDKLLSSNEYNVPGHWLCLKKS